MKDIDKSIICFLSQEEIKQLIKEAVAEEISASTLFTKGEESTYLTRAETAALLKISLPTLLKWTKEGKISAYRFGNTVRYKKHEIDNSLITINTFRNGKL